MNKKMKIYIIVTSTNYWESRTFLEIRSEIFPWLICEQSKQCAIEEVVKHIESNYEENLIDVNVLFADSMIGSCFEAVEEILNSKGKRLTWEFK